MSVSTANSKWRITQPKNNFLKPSSISQAALHRVYNKESFLNEGKKVNKN